MYRLLNNGLSMKISVYAEHRNPESLLKRKIQFKVEKGQVNGYVGDERAGTVRLRKDSSSISYLLQSKIPFYSWIESINSGVLVVEVTRPTEIVIGLNKISINTTGMQGTFSREMYCKKEDFPIPLHYGPVYIAKDQKTKKFYLFSAESQSAKPNKTLILKWEKDQLFIEKEESMNYKPEMKLKLLKQAKLFDTKLEFYETSHGRNDMVEANFHSYFERAEGYLDAWQKYMEYERTLMLEKKKQCKELSYDSFALQYGKVVFSLATKSDTSGWIDEVDQIAVEVKGKNRPIQVGILRHIDGNKVEVDYMVDDVIRNLPFQKEGKITVSTEMNEIASRRRKNALEKTLSRLSVIPDLGEFLSNPATVHDIQQYTYPFPMVNVETLVNGKSPDIPQEQAVKAALNTEDLVLIQGPPGTGKTSVIQTIMKCLIELGQKEILLTSYQHLAVDNAMDGLTEHGVLSHRFGSETHKERLLANYQQIAKNITDGFVFEDAFEERDQQFLSQFISDLKGFAQQKEFSASTANQLKDYIEKINTYEDLPSDAFIAMLDILEVLPEEPLEAVATIQEEGLHELYESLPNQIEEFKTRADLEQWKYFISKISNYLTKVQVSEAEAIIKEMKRYRQRLVLVKDDIETTHQFGEKLFRLKELCHGVMSNSRGTQRFDAEPIKEALQRLIVEVQEIQKLSEIALLDEEQKILKEYVRQIQADPMDLANLVGKYAQVKGATCQQTVAVRHGMYDNIFDAVIIDEAARANPLDLLIPMTLGKKVILVGDHKQLPHILEPQFEKETEISKDEFDAIYKRSIFERLYNWLPTSKKVMLKKQFRMHPTIGELVSTLFYPEGLEHGLDSLALPNDTGLYDGQNIAWVNVPFDGDGEKERYANEREADVLIGEVKKVLKTNAQYSGKIGIITFYNQQLSVLNKKLKNAGLEKNVQCGTVDAFQGKECEIVFLSTVRSNRYKNEGRALGFLRSPNRFNVALSRARRLLVIVGDTTTICKSDMFERAYRYVKERGFIDHHH
ncbi:TPA: AAA family ATPase [Yersinia enterocolitica]|nr:AAA family ATPase [Yersinia enterocolitica]